MLEGTVKWFSNAKGYGFIELSTGKEVFVHYSAIETAGYRSLSEGQKVAFELEQGLKGEHATQVRIEAPTAAEPSAAEPVLVTP